jgi:hypothetical protein
MGEMQHAGKILVWKLKRDGNGSDTQVYMGELYYDGKVKVQVSRCVMKAHRTSDGTDPLILIVLKSALNFISAALQYPLIGRWVGPIADLDVSEERKIPCT